MRPFLELSKIKYRHHRSRIDYSWFLQGDPSHLEKNHTHGSVDTDWGRAQVDQDQHARMTCHWKVEFDEMAMRSELRDSMSHIDSCIPHSPCIDMSLAQTGKRYIYDPMVVPHVRVFQSVPYVVCQHIRGETHSVSIQILQQNLMNHWRVLSPFRTVWIVCSVGAMNQCSLCLAGRYRAFVLAFLLVMNSERVPVVMLV